MRHIKALIGTLLVTGTIFSAAAQGQNDNYSPFYPYTDSTSAGYINRSYFSLNIGVAVPTGSYASTAGTAYRGYAMPGSNLNFNMGIPFSHSDMGIALMYGAISNPFNINRYAAHVQTTDEGRTYSPMVKDNYDISTISGGLYYTIPLHRVSFDFRAIAGVALCRFPEVGYAGYSYNPALGTTTTYSWDIASGTASAFAYNLGANIRYNFRNMAIIAGIDYLNTMPYINTIEQYTDAAGNHFYNTVAGTVPISVISFDLGFGFQLRKVAYA